MSFCSSSSLARRNVFFSNYSPQHLNIQPRRSFFPPLAPLMACSQLLFNFEAKKSSPAPRGAHSCAHGHSSNRQRTDPRWNKERRTISGNQNHIQLRLLALHTDWFKRPVGFVLHVHLRESPKNIFRKQRALQKILGRWWDESSVTFKAGQSDLFASR